MTELKTENGIKFVTIAILASLVLSLLSMFVYTVIVPGIVGAAFADSASSSSLDAMNSGFRLFMMITSALCLLGLGILALKIVGIVFIYLGREEFGREHCDKVKTGCILLIAGLVASFLPYFSALAGIASGLGTVFLIVAIAREKERRFLWVGFGINVALSISSLMFSFWMTPLFSIAFVMGYFIFMTIVGLAASILTLLAYYGTYKGIVNGEIIPGEGPRYKLDEHLPPVLTGKGSSPVPPSSSDMPVSAPVSAFPSSISPPVTEPSSRRGRRLSAYSRLFGISGSHAGKVYDAGYVYLRDLEYSTMDDLLLAEGINPTVARKITTRMTIWARDRKETIRRISQTFGISPYSAGALYDGGYCGEGDLLGVGMEELRVIRGMNPTAARKVVTRMMMQNKDG